MFEIAICDDDIQFCSYLETIILNYQRKIYDSFIIDVYYSGESLYSSLARNKFYDLIFLDIEMKQLTGIEVGKKIRNELDNDATHIVYVSSYPNYAMQLFRIRPIDFIAKPVDEASVHDAIRQSMILSNKHKKVFSFKADHFEQKIEVSDILYFESRNRVIEMVSIKGDDTFYGTLKGIYERLNPTQFIYIHRSFIINIHHVSKFGYHDVKMSNGTVLPIGKSYKKELRKFRKETEENLQ